MTDTDRIARQGIEQLLDDLARDRADSTRAPATPVPVPMTDEHVEWVRAYERNDGDSQE